MVVKMELELDFELETIVKQTNNKKETTGYAYTLRALSYDYQYMVIKDKTNNKFEFGKVYSMKLSHH